MQNKNSESRNGTPFDDVYRTLVSKATRLVIPLINEVFGTSYEKDERIAQLRNEQFVRDEKRITDSIFEIRGVRYHVECQSSNDETMSIRMLEYDMSIAIEHRESIGEDIFVRFPRSAVLYVRDNGNTPDVQNVRVVFSDGQEIVYSAKVMKVSMLSMDEIFTRHLLIVLPFYILRYEKQLRRMGTDKEMRGEFLRDIQTLIERLNDITEENTANVRKDVRDAIAKVARHVLRDNEGLIKEVDKIMGGTIYTLPSEYIQEGRTEEIRERISLLLLKKKTPEWIHEEMEYPMELILEVKESLDKENNG